MVNEYIVNQVLFKSVQTLLISVCVLIPNILFLMKSVKVAKPERVILSIILFIAYVMFSVSLIVVFVALIAKLFGHLY